MDHVFLRNGEAIWRCLSCGHVHVGTAAPEICPVCREAGAYFQVEPEDY